MMRWISVLLMVLLASCARHAPSENGTTQSASFDLYKRGDGRETIQCQGVPAHPICGSLEVGPESIYSDCSDDQFECIASADDVLAVPKAGFTLGQQYSVFGAT